MRNGVDPKQRFGSCVCRLYNRIFMRSNGKIREEAETINIY
jgi:hypothetical protein